MYLNIFSFYFEYLIKFNLYWLTISFLLITVMYYFFTSVNNLLNNKITNYISVFLIFTLLISFFILIIITYIYIQNNYEQNSCILLNKSYYTFKYTFYLNFLYSGIYKFNLSLDIFGLILLILAYIIGFFSILILDNKVFFFNIKYYFIFNLFLIIVYFFVCVSNYLLLFFFYECLLLPSFLFIYYISPSRRAIQASIYFVIWTQLGSILILLVITYFLIITGTADMYTLKLYDFSNLEENILYCLLFLGFGFKIPIWPFHYWLTKTHVETPSGFSIYLSGFLVKSALFGFYKLSIIFSLEINTFIYLIICILGVVDSSIKLWAQTDLKKLVAYCTIQEMNLIYLVFIWGDSRLIVSAFIFTIVHAFLSTLMFLAVDCIYRRYGSRSIVEVNGILQQTPNLGLSIIFIIIFFSGIPGTLKFLTEFLIFNALIELSFSTCAFLLIIVNVIGLIGFCKPWFNVLFGINLKSRSIMVLDLTKKEIFIFIFLFFSLFFFSFLSNIIF